MSRQQAKFNIAIDGPAGAGKSTVAQKVAARLGFVYIDTGAMYRAFAWKCRQEGFSPDDTAKVAGLVEQIEIELVPDSVTQKVFVDGHEVTREIRSNEISRIVSGYAKILAVRTVMVEKQKKLAAAKGVVMDGRDIGTHVLPDAEVKIYLTASAETRAKRRLMEIKEREAQPEVTLEQLKSEIEQRDRMDRERKVSPLTVAHDAVVIDSSALSVEEVTEHILQLCEKQR